MLSTTKEHVTLTWHSHHTWSPTSTSVDGYIIDDDTEEREQLDFITVTGLEDDLGASVEDIWPDLPLRAFLSAWMEDRVVELPNDDPGSVRTILLDSMARIPVALHHLGIMMG